MCQALVSPPCDIAMDQATAGRRRVGRIAAFCVGTAMIYEVV